MSQSYAEIFAKMTEKDCDEFFKTKGTDEKGTYYMNKFTGRKIRENADRFKKIKSHCNSLDKHISSAAASIASTSASVKKTSHSSLQELSISKSKRMKLTEDEIVEKWLSNPLIDPIKNKPISVDFDKASQYRLLYNMSYFYLKKLDLDNASIQARLPKNHYLYQNKIDLLFNEKINYENNILYDFMLKFLEDKGNISSRRLGYPSNFNVPEFEEYEKKIFCGIIDLIAFAIAKYAYFVNILISKSYTEFKAYITDVQKIRKDLRIASLFTNEIGHSDLIVYSFTESYIGNNMVLQMLKHFQKLDNNNDPNMPYDFSYMESKLIIHDNWLPSLTNYYDELYDIFNFSNAPDKSPFHNLENKTFEPIEDPLIKVINQFYQNGTFKHLNFKKLELPVRTFANDAEYEKLKKEYTHLAESYNNDKSQWKTEYEKIKSKTKKSPENLPMPKIPSVMIPIPGKDTKYELKVVQTFPKHIPDTEYAILEKTYKDNEKVINIYQDLINKNLLSLVKKDRQEYDSSSIYNLIDKDRVFFENNVLSNDYEENAMKCNTNDDILSGDNLADENYLLSKLQLTFQIQTKKDGNVIRTDCFYAPSMYNYIVRQINNKKPIINPFTRQPLNETDISNLMKIMNIIDPTLERPILIKPIHDTQLKVGHEVETYKGQPYARMFVYRKIGDFEIELFTICYILADIDVSESKSADTTSEKFVFSIYRLFNKGLLLKTYMPPYHDQNEEYILPDIPFAAFNEPKKWYKSRKEQLKMFVQHLEEVNRYLI